MSVEGLIRSAIGVETSVERLRRLGLLIDEFKNFYLASQAAPGDYDGKILIAETPLEVRLTLIPARPGGREVALQEVFEELKRRGITCGIRQEAIRAAWECSVRKRETIHRLVVGEGPRPEDGMDGSIEFAVKAFDKRVLLDPKEPFIGDLAAFVEEIKAGALVARVTPASPGRTGSDLRGNILPVTPGTPLPFGFGEGLLLVKDGRELLALVPGSLVVGEETIDLVPFHVVRGQLNVGQDIAFDGNVLVTGHVSGPVRIHAQDVYIAGNADGASISATGDAWVGGAIQGKSLVEAEGRVFARSARDATVRAMGDIVIRESILESRLASSGRVVASSERGLIEGGEVSAYRGIFAHTIGSAFGLLTTVKVGREDLRTTLLSELEKRLRENEEILGKIEEVKGRIARGKPTAKELPADQELQYISVLRKEVQVLEERRGLRRRQKRLESAGGDDSAPSISVTGPLQPPVAVEIGETSEVIQEFVQGVTLVLGPDRRVSLRKAALLGGETRRREAKKAPAGF